MDIKTLWLNLLATILLTFTLNSVSSASIVSEKIASGYQQASEQIALEQSRLEAALQQSFADFSYDGVSEFWVVPNSVDLSSAKRRKHILDGDSTGGGHRPGTGKPGKSEFPQGWSDDKIMHEISDIATDPNALVKNGRGGRTIAEGTREGIDIRVIQDKSGDIISGFPTNVTRNPK